MDKTYPADAIGSENEDPYEQSTHQFLSVPAILLTLLIIFGVTYIYRGTDSIDFTVGDSRSDPAELKLAEESGEESKMDLGGKLYKVHCQVCHQATGTGLGLAFPPLDGSEWVNGDPENIAAIVIHGLDGEIEVMGQTFNGSMPPFHDQFSPDEIAAIATYIRASWSNDAPEVDVEVVEKVIEATADRDGSWQGGAELEQMTWD